MESLVPPSWKIVHYQVNISVNVNGLHSTLQDVLLDNCET